MSFYSTSSHFTGVQKCKVDNVKISPELEKLETEVWAELRVGNLHFGLDFDPGFL